MKRVAVGAGGNTKGAFSAGALYYLTNAGEHFDEAYTISINSINFWIYSKLGPDHLMALWWNIGSMWDYFRPNWRGLFWSGLIDLMPLYKMLLPYEENPHTLKCNFGSIDLDSAQLGYGDSLIDAINSSTEPLYAPLFGARKLDGGLRDVAPISKALGKDVDEVWVFLNHPFPYGLGKQDPPKNWWEKLKRQHILSILARSFEIMSHEVFMNDLLAHIDDPRIRIIAPNKLYYGSLTFEVDTIREMFMRGAAEAKRVLDEYKAETK